MNAWNEFQEHVTKVGMPIVAVWFSFQRQQRDYTALGEPNLRAIKKFLNVKYDNGYGGQELFGTIWYADGTWSSREEYDGSEWWRHNKCPKLPT